MRRWKIKLRRLGRRPISPEIIEKRILTAAILTIHILRRWELLR
jgi:hypothetical protein